MMFRNQLSCMFVGGLAFLAISAYAQDQASTRETITPAFQIPMANAPGMTMSGFIVDYKPAGASPSHRHGDAFVVPYVLSGAVRSQVEGEPEKVFHAGEHWTEMPGAHHVMIANASRTEPARVLVIFIARTGETANDLIMWDDKGQATPKH